MPDGTNIDPALIDTDAYIGCPVCDALLLDVPVPNGAVARCHRCHTVLVAPHAGAMTQIVMLALTSLILMVVAVFFPFLELHVGAAVQRSSVFDAVMAFSTGLLLPLSFAVGALIVVLPALRLIAIIYTIAPMMIGWAPARHAVPMFRLAEALRPWAMAEIFVVGVAVAMVKVAGLAKLSMGPAFWAFVALVLITALKDSFTCKLTIWKTLENRKRS